MLSSDKPVKWAVTAIAVIAAMMLASAAAQAGTVLYVDDDAPLGGVGLSWGTPYRFLQDALAFACDSKNGIGEVRVGQGVYQPDRDEANPKGTCDPGPCDREATFQLCNAVALMGGYAGFGAPDPDARDIELYETILTGDLLGNDGPDFENNAENSYHVTTGSGTNQTAALDGFSITAGNANGPDHHDGGGMINLASSLVVTNCAFGGNSAAERGGGMYNHASSPAVTNCMFSANRVTGLATPGLGGGMSNNSSNPTLTNCSFNSNAAGIGGGMYSSSSNPSLTNCILWGGSPNEISGVGATVRYSNVAGGFAGIGNIDADPMFVDPDKADYRLASGSPCIDAGNNWGVPIDENDYDQDGNSAELFPVDLDGNPRFNADEADFDPGCGVPVVVDMGAYEYQFNPVEEVIFADLNGDGVVGILDLLGVLAAWGDARNNCLADLDIDGDVDILDLLTLLAHWG